MDPFSTDASLHRSAANTLEQLSQRLPTVIEPAYILSGGSGIDPTQLGLDARKAFDALAPGLPLPGLAPLRTVGASARSLSERADQLIRHAKATQASLIVVSTHARKGPGRWALGSFTETLALRSDVPLLVVNPECDCSQAFERILFATDFSPESDRALRQVGRVAREMGARLTLFHRMKYALTPTAEVAFSAYPRYRAIYEQDLEEREKELKRRMEECLREGIDADFVLEPIGPGSVADALLGRARALGCMIAMASHSGRMHRAWLGSTTRRVIRDSHQPLWIVHPGPAAAARSDGTSRAAGAA